ncbi:MAG: hypothetical protein EGR96_08255 [Clostridiales bacterium]|nr:hypothetical protein [Clostridiales bacterium]
MTISAFIMFGLPWIDATLVPNDAGMIAAIVLLFVVNPLYSIAVGMFAEGTDANRQLMKCHQLPVLHGQYRTTRRRVG